MRTDWEHLRMVSASAISPVLAYYTPTKGFLLALVLATFKEKLCRCVCATSTNQPFATVTYRNETPVLNGTTVFVPIPAEPAA